MNDDDKVVLLNKERAFKEGDNRLWSILDCLRTAIAEYHNAAEEDRPTGVIVLTVYAGTEEKPDFDVLYSMANVKSSQALAAADCFKIKILQQMGYLPIP